jgi:branched-chain amino acid transport system ATP-binding protein
VSSRSQIFDAGGPMRAHSAAAARLSPRVRQIEAPAVAHSAPAALAVAAPATVMALEQICLSFGGVSALSAVDLQLHAGEILAVIGPNGAGKSSLLNVMSGLYRPDTGRVALSGRSFTHVPTHRLARLGVARTFQNLALFKALTVVGNIRMGLVDNARTSFLGQIVGTPAARREAAESLARAEEIVDFLQLAEVRERVAGTLPYGIQKRVEFGRALIGRPRLLLLDEPMAGMTATDKQEMSGFIRDARDRFGTTIVLIEHDMGIVMGLSDRVAVFDYGRKIADGTPDAVSADQGVIDAYLGIAHSDETSEAA